MSRTKPTYQDLENQIKELESQNRTGILLDLVDLVIIELDPDGDIRSANYKASELLQCESDILIGKNWFDDFVPPEERFERKSAFAEIVRRKTTDPKAQEKPIVTLKGETRIFRWKYAPLTDASGRPAGVLCSGNDISELRHTKQKADLISTVVEQSANALVITDAKGDIVYVNAKFSELTEYEADEVIGLNPRVLKSGSRDTEFYQHLWETILSGQYWQGEFQNKSKSGKLYWEQATITPILDENGKIINFLAVKEDISRRKKNEKRLKKQKHEFESLYEEYKSINEELVSAKDKVEESEKQLKYSQKVARIGYYIFDTKTGRWTSSEMLDEIMGMDESYQRDVPGWLNLIHPSFKNEMHEYFIENILQKHESFDKKYPIVNQKTGESCWVHGLGSLELNEAGEITTIFGTIQDITKSKLVEDELIEAKDKAQESDRLKTEFINNMSHEIRTPMNGILGFSEFLSESDLSESKRLQYIKIIQNSGYQLLRIIDDILEISVLGTKQVQISEKEICLNDVFLEQFSIFDIRAKERKIPLYLKKGLNDVESMVFCDENKLKKILANLLENALKFTNTGYIEFGYSKVENWIQIYVKDTGIGIKPENQKRIFERFSQEEKELSKLTGGLGLGLSIAKENAELLGGQITLESEKGKGTTFFVRVQYKPVNQVVEGILLDVDSQKKQKKFVVLIAEDEEVNFLFLETAFEHQLGRVCELIHVKNGQDAIEFCMKNTPIDLVLMDLKMPGTGGFEATKQIKGIRPELPIVAQTAYSAKIDRGRAFTAGCDDFITKPIKPEELQKIIEKYLKNDS